MWWKRAVDVPKYRRVVCSKLPKPKGEGADYPLRRDGRQDIAISYAQTWGVRLQPGPRQATRA